MDEAIESQPEEPVHNCAAYTERDHSGGGHCTNCGRSVNLSGRVSISDPPTLEEHLCPVSLKPLGGEEWVHIGYTSLDAIDEAFLKPYSPADVDFVTSFRDTHHPLPDYDEWCD